MSEWKDNYLSNVLSIIALIVGFLSIVSEDLRDIGLIATAAIFMYALVNYYIRKINKNEESIKEIQESVDITKKIHDLEIKITKIEEGKCNCQKKGSSLLKRLFGLL